MDISFRTPVNNLEKPVNKVEVLNFWLASPLESRVGKRRSREGHPLQGTETFEEELGNWVLSREGHPLQGTETRYLQKRNRMGNFQMKPT